MTGTPDGYARLEGVLLRREDAEALALDLQLCGNAYIEATDERADGEVVYARRDPDKIDGFDRSRWRALT